MKKYVLALLAVAALAGTGFAQEVAPVTLRQIEFPRA